MAPISITGTSNGQGSTRPGIQGANGNLSDWWDDESGDLTIQHQNCMWNVHSAIVKESGWFRAATQDIRFNGVLDVPSFGEVKTANILHEVLAFLHTGEFACNVWEEVPSFLTCIHAYYVAEFFEIEALKKEMVSRIEGLSKIVISIYGKDRKPLWQIGETEEKTHLRSFLRAVTETETKFDWRAKLQKALYDSGERMATRLLELPEFQEFVATEIGKNFSRAIGLRDF